MLPAHSNLASLHPHLSCGPLPNSKATNNLLFLKSQDAFLYHSGCGHYGSLPSYGAFFFPLGFSDSLCFPPIHRLYLFCLLQAFFSSTRPLKSKHYLELCPRTLSLFPPYAKEFIHSMLKFNLDPRFSHLGACKLHLEKE